MTNFWLIQHLSFYLIVNVRESSKSIYKSNFNDRISRLFFPRAECSQILPFYFTVPKSFLHMRQRKTTSGLEAFFILERQRCVMSFVYHLVIF